MGSNRLQESSYSIIILTLTWDNGHNNNYELCWNAILEVLEIVDLIHKAIVRVKNKMSQTLKKSCLIETCYLYRNSPLHFYTIIAELNSVNGTG